MTTLHFTPDSQAVVHLREVDEVLARVIDALGPVELALPDDRFTALARSIVGQQLSVAAARTIWSRLSDLAGEIDAVSVAGLDETSMRGIGLSRAKAGYVRDLAVRVIDGTVELDRLDALSDEEVIRELTGVKGIGRWTAEMFLIFSLGRPDVFAVDDVGLQRAMNVVYGSDPSQLPHAQTADRWRPFRSVASLYLWAALDSTVLNPSTEP